jgi:hypothetical protein
MPPRRVSRTAALSPRKAGPVSDIGQLHRAIDHDPGACTAANAGAELRLDPGHARVPIHLLVEGIDAIEAKTLGQDKVKAVPE